MPVAFPRSFVNIAGVSPTGPVLWRCAISFPVLTILLIFFALPIHDGVHPIGNIENFKRWISFVSAIGSFDGLNLLLQSVVDQFAFAAYRIVYTNSAMPIFLAVAPGIIGSAFPATKLGPEDENQPENEYFIKQLTNAIPDILYVYDLEENAFIYLNHRISKILGYSKLEIQAMNGRIVETIVHPDDYQQLSRWVARCDRLKDGQVLKHDYRVRHKNGDWRWLQSRVVSFSRNAAGRLKQILAVAHDRTEQKLIEDALLESKTRNSSILRALPDLMFIQHEDGTYLDYSAGDSASLIASPDVFLGRNMRDILPPDIAPGIIECFEAARGSHEPQRCEYRTTVNGADSDWECRIIRCGKDKILSIIRNVTEEKRFEKSLAESEAKFRSQYRGIPIPTYTWKWDGDDFVLVDFNDEAVCANNADLNNLLGSRASEWFSGDPDVLIAFDKCLNGNTITQIELCGEFLRSGKGKYFDISIVPVLPDMVMVHARDVTERKNAELALRDSEEFNRSIIDSSNDCIKIVDLQGKLLYINTKGKDLLEMDDDSCLNGPWLELWDEVSRRELTRQTEEAKAGGLGRFQGQCPTAKGTLKWWNVLISPIPDSGGLADRLLVVSRDITEQKLAEERLRKKDQFFRSLIENAYDLVTVVRPDGTILYDSPACERIIGYGFGERIGRNSLEYLHPYDHERIERVFYEIINNVSMNSAVEYRLRHKSGSYVHLEGVGRLTTDESGEPVIVANIRDVTERKVKQEQLEQLSDRLRNLKDEERRRLARELHDDTAQNLALLSINLSAMQQMLSPDDTKANSVLAQSSKLVQESLRDVRTLSFVLHPPSLDEQGLVSAIRSLTDGFSARSEISVDLVEEISDRELAPEVETALYRIVQEGLTNIHRHSGSPTAHVILTEDDSQIILSIRDEGCGMPAGLLDPVKGPALMGVGIPGMQERLQLLGGKLKIESNPNGTTLTASVPF